MFGNFTAALRYYSSSVKVSVIILIFLPIFAVSAVAEQFLDAAIIFKRGVCVSNFAYCDLAPTVDRKILRIKDSWGWSKVKSLVDARS